MGPIVIPDATTHPNAVFTELRAITMNTSALLEIRPSQNFGTWGGSTPCQNLALSRASSSQNFEHPLPPLLVDFVRKMQLAMLRKFPEFLAGKSARDFQKFSAGKSSYVFFFEKLFCGKFFPLKSLGI